MNRDELLELVFGIPADELAPPKKWLSMTEPDDENLNVTHTRAVVGLDYRRVVVRDSQPPGPGVGVATTTVPVAALLHVCADPGHRGLGYASALVLSAHEEAATHRGVLFACVFSPPATRPFFERLGYQSPDGAPDGFLVCELGGRDLAWQEWPTGTVLRTPGDW